MGASETNIRIKRRSELSGYELTGVYNSDCISLMISGNKILIHP